MGIKDDYGAFGWINDMNMLLVEWTTNYFWLTIALFVFLGSLFGMSPLRTHHEQNFLQVILVKMRVFILIFSFFLFCLPFVMLYLYDMTVDKRMLGDSIDLFTKWFISLAKKDFIFVIIALVIGASLRFFFKRYFFPFLSKILRKFRNTQTQDELSDIRKEEDKYKSIEFNPEKYYKEGQKFLGLDIKKKPLYIPLKTWYETNMQIVGPTRYGKGIEIGNLLNQSIIRNDCTFYIDPKKDKFVPHIMYQAALKAGRKFYYVTLHDEGIGKWAPFSGGSFRDALSRIQQAFGLVKTGDPGTDYYKGKEMRILENAFEQTRSIEGLKNLVGNQDDSRLVDELTAWSKIKSLNPKNGKGFSIEKAIRENAVVYIQGSIDDEVVKAATKAFILELIQEGTRLYSERKHHITTYIDEVSFLVSKTLAESLATKLGFDMNFVLAYQSQKDLLNVDDKMINARYVEQSINVNTQLKLFYGGADVETAEMISKLSGTIVKEVTKIEKTAVSPVGGETWDKGRMIGTQQESLISENTILSLPPGVCALKRPAKLLTLCFTHFVKVDDMNLLNEYIRKKTEHNSTRPLEQPQKTDLTIDNPFLSNTINESTREVHEKTQTNDVDITDWLEIEKKPNSDDDKSNKRKEYQKDRKRRQKAKKMLNNDNSNQNVTTIQEIEVPNEIDDFV